MCSFIVESLSTVLGVSEPALRLLVSIFAGYPIAVIFNKYVADQSVSLQHVFCIMSGLLMGYWNYGLEIVHSLVAILVSYSVLATIGGTLLSVLVIFVFNMLYLLAGYHFAGTDNYDINWTMAQCVLVLRLVGTAFDLYDGQSASATAGVAGMQSSAHTTKSAPSAAITDGCPAPLEFLGHALFPGSCLVGPQFNLQRYRVFIAGEYRPYYNGGGGQSRESAAVQRALLGVFYLCVYQVLGCVVSDAHLLSDEYAASSLVRRWLLLGIWGRFTLYKYISCWLLSEGCCILFGIAYNGVDTTDGDGQLAARWDGVTNIKLAIFENTTEFTQYIQSFNVNTNQWVAAYIYKRLKCLNSRYVSQVGALLFLAVWHGFHSGYYVCFLLEFIIVYAERDLKAIIKSNATLTALVDTVNRSRTLSSGRQLLLRAYTFVFMGWCLLPFALLKSERYWRAFAATDYAGIWLFCLWPIVYAPVLRLLFRPEHKVARTKPHQQ